MPSMNDGADGIQGFASPSGFVFGVQGWSWGEQRPKGITFNLDGTCKVSDQWGRPIKGALIEEYKDNKPTGNRIEVLFAKVSHAKVIEALSHERISIEAMDCAGWPQLSYDELKKLPEKCIPPVPNEETAQIEYLNQLRKIKDGPLRKDALKFRREQYETLAKEMQLSQDE